jgi:hypothetical protein
MEDINTQKVNLILDIWAWFKKTMFAIGLVSSLISLNFVYKEWTRPGSAIMVGDLSNVGGKGK